MTGREGERTRDVQEAIGAAAPSANGRDDQETRTYGPGDPAGADWRGLSPRRWLTLAAAIAVIGIVGSLAGYAASYLMETQYGARSQLIYEVRQEAPTGFLREDRNLTTQVILLRSRAVLQPVAARSGLSFEELADKVRVSVVEGSEVIDLEVRDPDPAVGLRLARGIGERYLAAANEPTVRGRAYLQDQLTIVQERIRAGGLTPSQSSDLAARRADLLAQLDALTLSGAQASVLTEPYPTRGPVSPRRGWIAAAGALCGLLIGAAVAALLARRWARGGGRQTTT